MNQDFHAFLDSRHRSQSTRAVYLFTLERFESYCHKQGLAWSGVQLDQLESYHQNLLWASRVKGGLYSSHTLYLVTRILRELYRWAAGQRLVEVDPSSGWQLPRPESSEQPSLGYDQTLALLNLPNVSRPTGQRDHLLLELTYSCELSLIDCVALDLEWEERLEPARASWQRYVESARPSFERSDSPPALFLTPRGNAYVTAGTFRGILLGYGKRLDLPYNLSPQLLHRSARQHKERLAQRHSRAVAGCGILER